jgi:cyclic beta-1,2-glucan synthetase
MEAQRRLCHPEPPEGKLELDIGRTLDLLKLRRLRAFRRQRAAARTKPEQEPALRSELFSADQMERHGQVLAGQHRLSPNETSNLLLGRLDDNEAVLAHTCERLIAATRHRRRITPAGEWLLDNFYLIEEQIRIARRHLPKGYSKELPRLDSGPSAEMPRVYDIALEIISHGDGRVDTVSLTRFVNAYQTVTPLKLGELWAIPIMLRLALIENLRRVAARVIADWQYRGKAARWADNLTATAESDPKSVVLVVADMARSKPPMTGPFVAEMARRLQGQSPALALPLSWIEQRLSESGQTIEHLVQLEAQQQAADQVSIGNSIGSLRALSAIDWRDFVEQTSIVDQFLRQDPAGVYATMDFTTRDDYRHVVESIARKHKLNEPDVAEAALALCREGASAHPGAVAGHIGFYLIDKGRRSLEQRLGVTPTVAETLRRILDRAPLPIYLGLLALLTFALAHALVSSASHNDLPTWGLIGIAIPSVILASQLAMSLLNWIATLTVAPRQLPRMDYSAGIPESARTMVVVPSLFGSAQDIEDLVESLEVRFLGNRDPQLHFALLTDFPDAASETLPGDEALLRLARRRIEALNDKYATAEMDRFFLFHRPREWNAAERSWIGRERKRGKLGDLNALLRGGTRDRFLLIVGDIDTLPPVQYIITLDTDTQLPRESAHEFVGAIDHPLNRAVYDPAKRRVVSGYGVLQPRVGISLPSTARSRYAQLYASDAGIDPYTQMVSDVYQDVFHEGSFIGKGIYAIDAFELSLEGRFPDNAILSHDLVEGCHARSGLLSDVQLYEEYPARYSADVKRRHRWIRGDWQLLPWLLPWAPTAHDGWRKNALTALSRWKILDNLRRSLVPVSLLALLLIGWLLLAPALSWMLAVLAMVLIPPVLSAMLDLVQKQPEVQMDQHLRAAMHSTGQHLARMALGLAWLPHEVLYSVDAIVRTLWRMLVSRRLLLQWQTSSDVEKRSSNAPAALWRLMWIGPVLAVLLAGVLAWHRPSALLVAAPLLILWLLSPSIAWWISKPNLPPAFAPTAAQMQFLRMLARKTWAFFDTHVGPDDHWLPPDNVQIQPAPAVAHRTSPTNIGLALLANLAAYDFGFLSAGRLLDRTVQTLATMRRLPRHRGHFYNWYDTLTLQPLAPLYISAVDSGNLAGHLLTLRPGLLALADEPVFPPRALQGLLDTLDVLQRALFSAGAGVLSPLQRPLEAALAAPPATTGAAVALLQTLLDQAHGLARTLHVDAGSDAEFWLDALLQQCSDLLDETRHFHLDPAPDDDTSYWGIPTLRQLSRIEPLIWPDDADAETLRERARERIAVLEQVALETGELALMDYRFLYDRARDLLAIGYNVDERRLDAGFYDLLASEARLASFVAIAQGQLPQDNWFSLGRLLTTSGGQPVLLSWTGSMFEYLMPMLVMPSYEGTLLDQTCRAAVARQIEYGTQLNIPWGVSESGYNTLDAHFTYQYRAFGVPGLGLKRGLGDDVVIAPYATVMAMMVAPTASTRNMQRLVDAGAEGRLGFYEAIDYTPARLPLGQSSALVQSYMVHHQGMSLLALDYALLDKPMQRRFESDPQFQATSLLLQERVPKTAAEYLHASGFPEMDSQSRAAEARLRVFTEPDRARPAVQLLSNGRYHVMVSSAGGGYSRCRDMALTRWREDITSDNWGMFCYLRDVASGAYWSTAHQPTLRKTELFEAIFSDARAEFRVREREFDAHTEIVVSPEDDIELRRTRITNRSRTRRTIELTSFAEVVLAPPIADAMHPAFSKLFVQTELLEDLQAIVCTRRPRAHDEAVPWMCHLLAVHNGDIDEISYETDRARFIGRGRSAAAPLAMGTAGDPHARLSNSEGSVLDPIVAIRCRITLEPEQSVTVDFVTGMGDTRDACVQLIGKYRDRHLADRVFDLAWTHSQVLLRQLNASLADAQLYEHMATSIIYPSSNMRAEPGMIAANRRGQSGLWGQSISGDLPIVLLQIADPARIELVRQLVQAHAYWRLKGLAVDLVIWNEDRAGYRQELQDQIMGLIASGSEASLLDRPGGIFVRPAQQLSSEDRILVQASARIILADTRGTLAEQVSRRWVETHMPRFEPSKPRHSSSAIVPATPTPLASNPRGLQLSNPYGGFSADGREYVIVLGPTDATPAPWANVLANPHFGTVISESGGAYTWAENAHEFRLSPWHNDPVGDTSGEAIYLRDEETGQVWSPTPLPARGTGEYVTRHGFGYSVFEHTEDGICSELWVYVALDASVKFSLLKLRNDSGRPRRISATGYVEWMLGDLREKTAMHVVTESDPASGALFARNAYNTEFPGRVAFFDVDDPSRSIGGDRAEFLGRNGSMRSPAALGRTHLSGRLGAGLDPCGALQMTIELGEGENRDVVFRLGLGRDTADASGLVQRFRGAAAAADALAKVRGHWQRTLGAVQVKTPDPAIDVLANGWLLYQTIACRFWARSGYYQSGGAFGFRDQLQDSMAMIHAAPDSARRQILLCAAHQFHDGDVQHWWHPPLDRGVRTACSDDYLWLPLATARYVLATDDRQVLDETVGYIEGRPLHPGEESYYDLPQPSSLRETLYRHCVRAIEHSLVRGVHGLPLIGCGDWNDGMNRVGEAGRGESIWLGWFSCEVMNRFAAVARLHDDEAFALRCESEVAKLKIALEQNGWDGAWYRRAYYDDGTPLGSAPNDECRIDSIAQSWSVISGVADPARQLQAMNSLDQHLVRRDSRLVQLLDPPFDKSPLDPGYIKGYVPGVRENGGQYTHAAIWATMAFAELGDSARAWELLRMINPLSHTRDAGEIDVYKVEPYVVSADVYAVQPHVGRGGWSWYTGSAGWMYRLVVESLLGLHMDAGHLTFAPVLPADWEGFSMRYRYRQTWYQIDVTQVAADAPRTLRLDGDVVADGRVLLTNDGQEHRVQLRHPLSSDAPPSSVMRT